MIVRGDVDVSAATDSLEGTFPRFSAGRHPRSAVGVSRDGRTLWLVAVGGRSTTSVGMTLPELGALLRELGAWDAMNLDGGGSTALVLRGRGVVSAPSDPAGERTVGSVVLLIEGAARR